MKKLAVILFFLLLGNCAIHLWGADCACSGIAGLQEYSYTYDINLSESQPAGIGNISANLYTVTVQETPNHSQTGKGGTSTNTFQCRTGSNHHTRYLRRAFRKGALIIHSSRSADRYVLELEKIII